LEKQLNITCWHYWPYKLTWAFVVNLHATTKKDLFVEKKGKEDMVLIR
jgi:hypothetical protein